MGEHTRQLKYRYPPIVEAICEFRFSKETNWDPTVPGLVYDRVKDQFPNKETKLGQAIELKADESGFRQNIVPSQRFVMLAEDRKSLIQIGQHVLSINHLKPYPGWEYFKPKIRLAFETLNDITNIQGIDRIALVYIDKIEIPGKEIKLEDYFKFYPYLGSDFPPMFNFIAGCAFLYQDKRDICRLQLTSAMPDNKENSAVILSTEYFLAKKNSIGPDRALDWIENAHIVVRDLFKGSITERLESLFERVK